MIPFSPPHIAEEAKQLILDTLDSGWITTGPKTKQLEKEITKYCGNKVTLCVNSATSGLELVLRWLGVGPGDEVILPSYTYSATANVVEHCGAVPVLVDVNSDFNISVEAIRKAITPNTKVIMPVDFAGYPCNYDEINALVRDPEIVALFKAQSNEQEQLGRILVLADAAHSFGASYKGKKSGSLTDISVFSFHAVKNLTTAEGGAIAFNLEDAFDHEALYKFFCTFSLHGQNKDALAKTKKGNWRYDIIMPGYKCNMTDLQASLGLAGLAIYDQKDLPKRKSIFKAYSEAFSKFDWAELPLYEEIQKESSYHIYALRIKGITESQRDEILQNIFNKDVSVNVHFIPIPLLSYYKEKGYSIENYPVCYDNYSREISLPVYYSLTQEQVSIVIKAVIDSVEKVLKEHVV